MAGEDYTALFEAAGAKHNVDPALLAVVAHQESRFNPKATSVQGAGGVMQIMPRTAKKLGVDPYNTPEAIDGAARLLANSLDRNNGDVEQAVGEYHGGPNRKIWGPKNAAYRKAVLAAYQGGETLKPATDVSDDAILAAAAGSVPTGTKPAAKSGADMSDDAILAAAGGGGDAATLTAAKPSAAPAPGAPKPDLGLGLLKGAYTPTENASRWMEGGLRKLTGGDLSGLENAGAALRKILPEGLTSFIDSPQAFYDAQAAKGKTPSKLGEFGGNVLGTSLVPGGPLVQGAVGGALLSNAKDAKGLLGDTLMGGVAGRATALGSDALQLGARKLLSKAPSIMDIPALESAVKAAYAKVDASGFKIPRLDMKSLADGVVADLRAKGGPKAAKLYGDADAFAARLKELATQKGGVSVSQLDTLRSDIYDALIKPGGKEAGIGKAIRGKIDGLIDSLPNGDIKAARELYTRLSKLRTVTKALDSGELRNASTFTGKNENNVIRQKLRPLLDPQSGKRIANATADEIAALRNAITGTKAQNAVRTIGTLLDPRGIIGAAVQTGAGVKTAGATLPSILLGMAATHAGNKATAANAENLIRIIAAGGSKRALAKTPTKASHALETLIAGARPGLVAASVPALAAAKEPDRQRK